MVIDGITSGIVIFLNVIHLEAPSILALSISSPGMFCIPAIYIIIIYPICCQFSKITNPQNPYLGSIVKFTPKAASEIVEKLLKSAIANAENNHGMKSNKLYVAEIYANQGPTLRRIRPAAKGSAVRIRKRTSHITIVLKERD